MTTLQRYFEEEARASLAALDESLQSAAPDAATMHRAVRALRGAAQLARRTDVLGEVTPFEAVLRAVAAGRLEWSDELAERARQSVAALRSALSSAAGDDASQPGEVWHDVDAAAAPPRQAEAVASEIGAEFRTWVAREIQGIAGVLDEALQRLVAEPMDREPLKAVLRRQAPLLGATRLDDVPVVAEVLRAIEDMTRVVAKLDVGVKQEWLDIYRIARDALRAAVEPLQHDTDPPASNAASRLRHIRHEMLERYGKAENATFAAPEPVLELSDEEVVPDAPAAADEVAVENLLYDRDSALHRALELRGAIERATAGDPRAQEAVDELFDLIRIALE